MDISQWIADLASEDSTLRASAAQSLASLGEAAGAAAIPLVRAAGDDDEAVREWAVAALEQMGAPAVEETETLAQLLSSPIADCGYWAATLLGRLGPDASAAVPQLIWGLGERRDLAVRQRCAWALGKIGKAAASAAGALGQAAQSDDPRLARLAQKALDELR